MSRFVPSSITFILAVGSWACLPWAGDSISDHVNPLIGTASSYEFSNGNTYPSVSLPFGMTAWTPQTGEFGWIYTYDATRIQGLRATHQPSPWMGDYGQVSFMPMLGQVVTDDQARAATFAHEQESAHPYYYAVELSESQIRMEVAPSSRAAQLQFTFPKHELATLVMDASKGPAEVQIDLEAQKISLVARINSGGVPNGFACYYVIYVDGPFEDVGVWQSKELAPGQTSISGTDVGAYLQFDAREAHNVRLRVGTSFISLEQAERNLAREIGEKTFDEVVAEARESWDQALGQIELEGATQDQLTTFYTAMYRSMLFPRPLHELNQAGELVHYSPYDGQVHPGPMYVDNGFWDTFRAVFPLFSLLMPDRHADILNGLVNSYEEGDWFPKWTSPGYRNVMIGTHTASLFADAYAKGIRDFDAETAYEGMVKDALSPPAPGGPGRIGNLYYQQLGYVPSDLVHEATARTLEFAYGDFCVGQMAKMMGDTNDYRFFSESSYNYQNVYDPEVGFMRGRLSDGDWRPDFSPIEWGGPFTEGSSWHYSWSVMHDPEGLIELMGGDSAFVAKLDQLFSTPPAFEVGSYQREIHEMTEMVEGGMGQYAHGNQPIHHVIYLYNYAGQPWKTQERVREVLTRLYGPGPDGLCGDEDNGQMSAWYLFSALGFYPVCPGVPQYVLGAPLFKRATIHLPNGQDLVIEAPANGPDKPYVQGVRLNGEPLTQNWISHDALAAGGTLSFDMGTTPQTEWGSQEEARPYSLSHELSRATLDSLTFIEPFFRETVAQPVFEDLPTHYRDNLLLVSVDSETPGALIYLTRDGSEPTEASELYTGGVVLEEETTTLKARAYRDDMYKSPVATKRFIHVPHDYTVRYQAQPEEAYTAGGSLALVDGVTGSPNFRDGNWQGFLDQPLSVTIDLKEEMNLKSLSTHFLVDQGSWIFLPETVTFSLSTNGYQYREVFRAPLDADKQVDGSMIRPLEQSFSGEPARYIRVEATPMESPPLWHSPNAEGGIWLFVDEVSFEAN